MMKLNFPFHMPLGIYNYKFMTVGTPNSTEVKIVGARGITLPVVRICSNFQSSNSLD